MGVLGLACGNSLQDCNEKGLPLAPAMPSPLHRPIRGKMMSGAARHARNTVTRRGETIECGISNSSGALVRDQHHVSVRGETEGVSVCIVQLVHVQTIKCVYTVSLDSIWRSCSWQRRPYTCQQRCTNHPPCSSSSLNLDDASHKLNAIQTEHQCMAFAFSFYHALFFLSPFCRFLTRA